MPQHTKLRETQTEARGRWPSQTRAGYRSVPPLGSVPWLDRDVETTYGRVCVRLGRGTGLPLLMLHGISHSKEVFARQMRGAFADTTRFIAVDLPGHGASADSSEPDRAYTVSGYTNAVIEVLEQLDVTQVVLFGWSLGGHVALDLASRYPGVLGVMLCGTPLIGSAPDTIQAELGVRTELALTGKADLGSSDVGRVCALTFGAETGDALSTAVARGDGRARSIMLADLLAGHAGDQRAFAETTPIPIAIVNGADDPVVDVAKLRQLRFGSMWYGRPFLVPRAGHAPFLTQPDGFDRIFARFLRSMQRRYTRATRAPDCWLAG